MPKRKRLILPYGAAEADSIELENNFGFMTHYGQPERTFAITLRGNATAMCVDAFRLSDDTVAVLVPFGTPIEVHTL